MGLVHTLVAEVLAHLIDTLETTNNQSLQVELGSDAHVHILIERIEMGDEWAGTGTSCDILQDRRVDLGITGIVKNATQRADDGGTLEECIFDTLVNHQVNIALAIAKFWIVEFVISHTILILHDRQRFEGFRQQGEFLAVYADLASLCTKHKAFDANEVANVHQLLEDYIIEVFILIGADVIASDIYLNTPFRIL